MNCSTLISTLVGGVIAGGATLAAIWIKQFYDKRKSLQEWFYDYYITNCVDEILISLLRWKTVVDQCVIYLKEPDYNSFYKGIQAPPDLISNRIYDLIGSEIIWMRFQYLFVALRGNSQRKESRENILNIFEELKNTIKLMSEFKRILLMKITLIKNFTDVYMLCNDEDVKDIVNKLGVNQIPFVNKILSEYFDKKNHEQ